jgi:spermidine synthase
VLPALFAFAIFVNAGLLFWLEPLFAKLVLPLLGGAPAVWNTCLVFYQIALLAGYLWAHLGTRLGGRTQLWLHFGLCAAAVTMLPFAVSAAWLPPSYDTPVPWLLGVLGASVGLPFVMLAANGPLLQRWYAASGTRGSSNPYLLYAASNLGSAAALLLFPVVFEPAMTLASQSRGWQVGYVLNVLAVGACAALALRSRAPAPQAAASGGEADPVSWARRGRWVALAAVPSSLMMGVTTYISTEIASIPLIWIVPLALYLGTLVLAFANFEALNRFVRSVFTERLDRRTSLVAAGTVLAAVVILLVTVATLGSKAAIVVAHLLVFFAAALICHVQLAELRPEAASLTDFYLWLGVGGALGGVFNALVGPKLFTSVLEYPLALCAVVMLLPAPRGRDVRFRWGDIGWPVLVGIIGAALPALLRLAGWAPPFSPRLLLALPAVACLAFSGRPLRFGLGVAAVVLASAAYPAEIGNIEHSERNFFGVHRVLRDDAAGFRWLTHGTTVHGGQKLLEQTDPTPLTYHHPLGPLGDVFAVISPRRVAVIGLGAGAMAYYGRSGQAWTFYEIDPTVVANARRYFTFLTNPRPTVRMVVGDARLTMTLDSTARYDLIVLDAFGSDAIPVHLLTREAMQMYWSRLEPGGLLAMHLSNRFLDFTPLAAALAADAGLSAIERVDLNEPAVPGKYQSHYVVFARDSSALDALSLRSGWHALRGGRGRVWTDDYSSILPFFRRAEPSSP